MLRAVLGQRRMALSCPILLQTDDTALALSACKRSIYDWPMPACVPGAAERGIVGRR
jgi:hypothetical protein